MSSVFEILNEQLPPMVPRSKFSQVMGPFFGGATFSEKYLANLDSKGEGPKYIKIGKKVFYPKADLISWLEMKMN